MVELHAKECAYAKSLWWKETKADNDALRLCCFAFARMLRFKDAPESEVLEAPGDANGVRSTLAVHRLGYWAGGAARIQQAMQAAPASKDISSR